MENYSRYPVCYEADDAPFTSAWRDRVKILVRPACIALGEGKLRLLNLKMGRFKLHDAMSDPGVYPLSFEQTQVKGLGWTYRKATLVDL